MAGCDDDAGRGPALDDLERGHLGRNRLAGEDYRDVVGQDHLGGGGREMLAGETAVVSEDDATSPIAALHDVLGHGLGATADVRERVVVGDLGSPAVRAEDDTSWLGCG